MKRLAFAPAVVGNDVPDLWVCVVAPPVGAVFGCGLFRLFHADGVAEEGQARTTEEPEMFDW